MTASDSWPTELRNDSRNHFSNDSGASEAQEIGFLQTRARSGTPTSDYLVPDRLGAHRSGVPTEAAHPATEQPARSALAEGAAATPAAPVPSARKKRRSPRSVEERLIAIEKQEGVLRAKVAERRDELRGGLIAELYEKYGVGEFSADPSEARRIQELRERLGLR